MSRTILFLDLATTTGWAEGEPGQRATSGSIRLGKGSTNGEVGKAFNAFLAPRLKAFPPARVIYESPFVAGMKNVNTVRLTFGLAFMTETICEIFGVPCMEANLNSIRKHVLGRVPRGGDAKPVVIEHVTSLGYEPQDDNAADAICGWLYACAVLSPKTAQAGTPLFGRG